MSILAILALALSLQPANIVDNNSSIEITPIAIPTDINPKWSSKSFKITNLSPHPFFIYGYSPNDPFIQIQTQNLETQKWENYLIGYCGTGAKLHRIPSYSSFNISVRLPPEFAHRPFIFEFQKYTSLTDKKGITIKTIPLD